jgi:hypothetical protein
MPKQFLSFKLFPKALNPSIYLSAKFHSSSAHFQIGVFLNANHLFYGIPAAVTASKARGVPLSWKVKIGMNLFSTSFPNKFSML